MPVVSTLCFCSKLSAQFHSMEVRNSQFAAYIDVFTPNTYVLVVTSDSSLRKFTVRSGISCTTTLQVCYSLFENMYILQIKFLYFLR